MAQSWLCGNSKLARVTTHAISILACGLCGCSQSPLGPNATFRLVGDHAASPAWSPDGHSIAYRHFNPIPADTSHAPTGIYLIGSSGGPSVPLVHGFYGNPDWSPDGKSIACLGPNFRVTVISVETGNAMDVGPSPAFFPSWSGDGSWLAFDTSEGDPRGAHVVWIMRSNGEDATDISQHGVGEWRDPDWCPTDGRLVIQRYYDVTWPEIALLDTSGADLGRLTNDQTNDGQPVWSPDGKSIAWTRGHGPKSEVWVMLADGRFARRVAVGRDPSWSPDGRRLVITCQETGDETALYLVDVTYVP